VVGATGERTKAAIAVLKSRGVKLGTTENLTQEARAKGVRKSGTMRTAQAIEEMEDVTPIAVRMRSDGCKLQDIADHLNVEGYVTRQGGLGRQPKSCE
jgi:hypothetical protein